jgi:apolipoprotein N-acyltransferase
MINTLLALLSAAMLILLFPPYNLSWLAPVAVAPLIVASARAQSWKARFALGYTTGFVYWFGICHWISWTLAHHAGVSNTTAWLLFLLFCFAKAAQMGIFGILAGPLTRSPFALPAIGALWVVLEWSHIYTAFEWLLLGNAGSNMALPLRIAPYTGVWGMSFLFATLGTAVAILVLRRNRVAVAWLLLWPILWLLPNMNIPQPASASAVVVQPNIDDETIWTPELLAKQTQRLEVLSMAPVLAADRKVDLIVWPEIPLPFYDYDPDFRNMISSLARRANAGFITGAVARSESKAPLNAAISVAPDGTIQARYDKVNLVPFGEFVPWPFTYVTNKISTEAGDFEPGRNVVVVQLGQHKVGTFICYETVFPAYVRQFAKQGAEVLLNISNDAWFGRTPARYQHLLIARMRAVENRRWLLRVTNNGVTATIDPAGRVRLSAEEFQEVVARMPFGYATGQTLYTRWGDWFVAVCAGVVLLEFIGWRAE